MLARARVHVYVCVRARVPRVVAAARRELLASWGTQPGGGASPLRSPTKDESWDQWLLDPKAARKAAAARMLAHREPKHSPLARAKPSMPRSNSVAAMGRLGKGAPGSAGSAKYGSETAMPSAAERLPASPMVRGGGGGGVVLGQRSLPPVTTNWAAPGFLSHGPDHEDLAQVFRTKFASVEKHRRRRLQDHRERTERRAKARAAATTAAAAALAGHPRDTRSRGEPDVTTLPLIDLSTQSLSLRSIDPMRRQRTLDAHPPTPGRGALAGAAGDIQVGDVFLLRDLRTDDRPFFHVIDLLPNNQVLGLKKHSQDVLDDTDGNHTAVLEADRLADPGRAERLLVIERPTKSLFDQGGGYGAPASDDLTFTSALSRVSHDDASQFFGNDARREFFERFRGLAKSCASANATVFGVDPAPTAPTAAHDALDADLASWSSALSPLASDGSASFASSSVASMSFLRQCTSSNLPPWPLLTKCQDVERPTLSLAGLGIGRQFASAVACSVGALSFLQVLDLTNNRLDATSGRQLVLALAGCPELWKLSLDQNRIGTKGVAALAALCEHNEALVAVSVASNKLNDSALRPLLKAQLEGRGKLAALRLSNNTLGLASAKTLALVLVQGKRSQLKHLDLSWNRLGDAGVAALLGPVAKAPTNTTLRSLDLTMNAVGRVGCASVAAWLTNGPSAHRVLLAQNLLDASVGRALLVALQTRNAAGSPNLATLDVSDNGVGEELEAELRAMLSEDDMTELRTDEDENMDNDPFR